MAQAKGASGDRDVMVHGAYAARRALEAELGGLPNPAAALAGRRRCPANAAAELSAGADGDGQRARLDGR
jgi:hypothetical protein